MSSVEHAGQENESPASFARRAADRIKRVLAQRRLPLAAAILSAVAVIPALGGGFQFDDWFQRVTMLGYGDSRPIQVFVQYIDRQHNLSQMHFGTMPWWGSPHLHQAFLRYASALSMMLDYALWPDHPALMHLHSLLWLSAAVLAAALLYREVLGPTWVAGLAALMYALDGAHAIPAAYLANRNALIACCFGFLSVLAFARWREHGKTGARWLSVLMLALALSAGEMGLATAAYLFSYAVTVDRDGIRAKLARLLPHAGVLGAWALIYKLGNFGSQGSGFYLDPLHNPLGFAASFSKRAAFLLMGQWTPIPAEMSMIPPPGSAAFFHMSLFSFGITVLLLILFLPLVLHDRVARFWALGAALSLIPIGAVGPENRLLGFVGLGSMALLAQLTKFVFARTPSVSVPRLWSGLASAATPILLLVHLVAAPLVGIARIDYQTKVSSRMMRALASVPTDPRIASQDLVLINPPDQISLVTAIWAMRRLDDRPMPAHLRALSTGGTLEVTRVGPRTLRVRFLSGLFPTEYSRFLRSPGDSFSAGQRVELPGLSVTVESLDSHGDPAAVLYEFAAPLEDQSLRWMRWKEGRYVPWNPPPVGQTTRLVAVHGIY
jgi:hypothetical protein